jgi:DNA-binding beta-propeller fold protein YncE
LILILFTIACDAPPTRFHPAETMHYPVGIAADPAGDFLYLNNTNFDVAFDYGNVIALDLNTHRLVAESAVQVPGFGGELVIHAPDGQDPRLYLPTRQGDSLVWLKVTRDEESNSPRLSCNDDASLVGLEATVCAGNYLLAVADDKDPNAGPGHEPFGAVFHQLTGSDVGHLYVSSFDGELSVFRVDESGQPTLSDSQDLVFGLYDVAVHPQTQHVYATTKSANVLMNMQVSDNGDEEKVGIEVGNSIVVTNATLGTDFGRGIAFNAAGTRAWVAYRTPPSLLVVDTSLDSDGMPRNRVLDAIAVGNGPADVVVAPSAADGSELVYVSTYNADQIYVIDPHLMIVVDVIDTGNGPFDMTVVKNDDRFRLYVSLFEENAIGVIELDRATGFYHQEVARVP